MVWGKEGKPASRRRWGLLKAACIMVEFLILFLFLIFFFSSQEEASRGVCDDRSSVHAVLSEKKMDSSNHNKVKVMATQLLAKFEENAPAPQAGLKRQVGESPAYRQVTSISFCLVNILWCTLACSHMKGGTGGYRYIITLMSWGSERRLWPGSLFVPAACGWLLRADWPQRVNQVGRAWFCPWAWEGEVGRPDTRQCCWRKERNLYCCSVEKKESDRCLPCFWLIFWSLEQSDLTAQANSGSDLWFKRGINVHAAPQVWLLLALRWADSIDAAHLLIGSIFRSNKAKGQFG